MISLSDIKKIFVPKAFPTADQFWNTFGSFWHKSERLPQTQVLGLNDALNARATNTRVDSLENTVSQKADRSELDNLIGGILPQGEVATTNDLPTDPETVKTGYSYIVTAEKEPESGLSYIYVAEIVADGNDVKTVTWKNTKLTKYPSDVATKNEVAVKANIADLPNNPNNETITYTKPDFSLTTETGGDINGTWYANDVSKVTQAGALKGIVIKTTAAGVAKVKAISVEINGTNVSYKDLHTYTNIAVVAGENTYNINDSFVLPVGSYIAVTFDSLIGYYSPLIGVNSIRIAGTTATLSKVNVAYRIITTGATVARDILTESHADTLYLKQGSDIGVNIDLWADNVILTGYIGTNGQIASSSDTNWQRSDFMNFSENASLDIRCYGHTAVNTVSFYDENKIFISGVVADKNGTFESIVTSPVGTRFIKLSGGSDTYAVAQSSKPFRAINSVSVLSELESLQNQINDISPKTVLTVNRKQVKLMLAGGKIILYGDSISSTDYKWYKDAMEALTGANVYNGGFSGHSTASLAGDARLQRIFDYNPNLIISLVGGNDTGQVVGTFGAIAGEPLVTETDINIDYNGTYFIQAVSHIIRKVKARYYNIRERANLDGTETPAQMEAKIDAVLKPYFVFCTTLPQKRNDENNAFSNPENWARKRNAVIECCIKYDVHCIDLFNLVGWDMGLEPFWVSPTSMTNNRGIYTMDGLHPNKYGYQQMASIVCGELGII